MNKPTIDQYLLSTCLFIIDELNEKYEDVEPDDLKIIADQKFNEMDLCVRIGYPFKQMVHYTKGDTRSKTKSKKNHDLFIESKDFNIEVKYLRNSLNKSDNFTQGIQWAVIQKDFDWLKEEIDEGNKHNRAVILGWFNCYDTFSQCIQLGGKSGSKPTAATHKMCYFPFLKHSKSRTDDIFPYDYEYNYNSAYKPIPLFAHHLSNIECLFLGNEDDKFHFAVYY